MTATGSAPEGGPHPVRGAVGDRVVYCDEPDYDRHWLAMRAEQDARRLAIALLKQVGFTRA